MNELNRTEQGLLLYLESCLVDNQGYVQGIKMNTDDLEIAKRWAREGFIQFERLKFGDGTMEVANQYTGDARNTTRRTHRVRFSDAAWDEAHRLRRTRSERMCAKADELILKDVSQ